MVAQVEDEGIATSEEGRQRAVQPIVRPSVAFPEGVVQVLDAPQYIDPNLIHALPAPELSRHLGAVVETRDVRSADSPPPGHCWYVAQNVPCLGPRRRLWQQTDWPDPEEMTDADWSAFVSWWNTGVDGGWDIFSQLNATDDPQDLRPRFLHGVPAAVVARLKRTPALAAWRDTRVLTRSERSRARLKQTGDRSSPALHGTAPTVRRAARRR